MPSDRSQALFFLALAVVLSLTFSIGAYVQGLPVIVEGPMVAISETTKSLLHSGSLQPEYFTETYREAQAYSKGGLVWQDVFALDKHGGLRPKHSIFSSIVAVPFYAVFGTAGFWVLQQLFLLWLLCSTYLIVEILSGRALPWSTLLATCFLTQTLFYSYSFSYDLHGCALLVGGLYISRKHPLIGAVIMTLSLFVRPAFGLLAFPLLFAWRQTATKEGAIAPALLGFAIVSLGFMLMNYFFWGSPFLTAYARLPSFEYGEMYFSRHPVGFDREVFLSGWSRKVFSDQGVLPYNLSFVALPFVALSVRKDREWRFQIFCILVSFGYALYIFSYRMWSVTDHGNRFLFPSIYLYLFSFILLIGRLEARWYATSNATKITVEQ